ncbi:unnamed protein product [Acanthosepion pharaonis]|uniref:Uncharacterized protein n=1 Tax=Acanthosepion pharaonis TaxID=158019 RepID=A0A812CCH9_ACAPH|nr:unnamed protein product [Sepia pharaonis]
MGSSFTSLYVCACYPSVGTGSSSSFLDLSSAHIVNEELEELLSQQQQIEGSYKKAIAKKQQLKSKTKYSQSLAKADDEIESIVLTSISSCSLHFQDLYSPSLFLIFFLTPSTSKTLQSFSLYSISPYPLLFVNVYSPSLFLLFLLASFFLFTFSIIFIFYLPLYLFHLFLLSSFIFITLLHFSFKVFFSLPLPLIIFSFFFLYSSLPFLKFNLSLYKYLQCYLSITVIFYLF